MITAPDEQSKARVLVVEDDPIVRQVIVRVGQAAGLDTCEARDGLEASKLLAKQSVDVVVTDIAMPNMNGVELLRMVSIHDPDIPVILVTGAPTLDTAMRAVEHGAFRYITKPFDVNELARLMNEAIRLRRFAGLKRRALALSGLPGGRVGDLGGLTAAYLRSLTGMWMEYQPIVRPDGSVFGYEALLRSDEPSLPGPGAILQVAEHLGRISELGRSVRQHIASDMASTADDVLLFINVHPRELLDDSLLEATPLAEMANRCVLEITERAALHDLSSVRWRVSRLREQGFRIAVDDLGAGYAGLTSFATLQPDIVKLDTSLLRGVDRDPLRQRLIRSVAELCKEMSILVVAEGIETTEEREAAVALQCDLLQGYALGRPKRHTSFAAYENRGTER